MIERRAFEGLGHANHGWLNARHHFSFGSWYDPNRMGWGALRVWNDDEIAPQTGFAPHPHSDMEIITYVRSGAITHQDSMGNSGRTEAGDVQVMSAGAGVRHSEYNREDETTTLFQIWIEPRTRAARRPGGPSLSPRPTVQAVSWLWPAALPMTREPCRSVPKRGCWERLSRLVRPWPMSSARGVTPI